MTLDFDHDSHITLDAPAGLSLRPPPERPSAIRILPFGSDEPAFTVELDPDDDPPVDAELAEAARRVRAACAEPAQDAPGEPDDAEPLPEGAEPAVTILAPRRCPCGVDLAGRHARAQHCSVRCRVAAHRARRPVPALFVREDGRR